MAIDALVQDLLAAEARASAREVKPRSTGRTAATSGRPALQADAVWWKRRLSRRTRPRRTVVAPGSVILRSARPHGNG